jgi:AAA family ATP:ADP antiporter
MLMAWLFTGLTQGLGLGLAAVAVVGAGIAALWSVVGIYLGRWFERDDPESILDATSDSRESSINEL